MWKYFSYAGLILSIGGLVLQNFQLQHAHDSLVKQVKNLEERLNAEKAQETHLQQNLKQETSEVQREVQLRESELTSLSQQIVQEEQKREQLKKSLDLLKSQSSGPDNSGISARIRSDQEQIEILNRRLREYQTAEKEYNKEGAQTLNVAKNQIKQEQTDLEQQIRLQQATLKDIDKQIATWNGRKHDVNQLTQLASLKKQKLDQQTVLEQLNDEKMTLLRRENQKSAQFKTNLNQETESFKDTEIQIKQQLQMAEADLKKLQSELGKEKTDKDKSTIALKNGQFLFDQQNQKVISLTQDYERKSQNLQAIEKNKN